MLQRNYFFEFAGMPKSGKTTIMDIVAHFLKREMYRIEEYNGGSKYNPLYNAPIADLNLSLACRAVEFVVSTSRRDANYTVYLLDRGLIDRCIFTNALLQHNKIDDFQARSISAFLTQPRLLECLDGVFIFVTSPEIALEREYTNKLIKSSGEVMEVGFLSTMYLATIDAYNKSQSYVRNVHLIDTEQDNMRVQKTAELVVENILSVITGKENRLVSSLR